jgi:peptide/nickel transport system ATP-binding protein
MYKGEVVEFDQANKVINNPNHPYTQGLLKCRPNLNSKPYRLPVLSDFLTPKSESEEPIPTKTTTQQKIPILSVQGLTKKFITETSFLGKTKKELLAVNNINFEVYKGETLGLVGESGSGKSTVSRLITLLISTNSGLINYNGISLKNLTKKGLKDFHKKVQLIFQDPYSSLNPKITAGQAIMEPMIVHNIYSTTKEREQEARLLLQKVKLSSESFYKYPHEFSGGQRQRIVIARALAVKPEFIICDESVSALDVSVQAEILNLLNDFKEEFNLTYIFISHDLAVVKYMSDRIMVLKEGQLVEINVTDKLYNSPVSEYTRNLIESIPVI